MIVLNVLKVLEVFDLLLTVVLQLVGHVVDIDFWFDLDVLIAIEVVEQVVSAFKDFADFVFGVCYDKESD